MDWMFSNGGAASYVLIPLGAYYNDEYYTNDQCSTNLEDLVAQLQSDDPKNHSRRLGLGFIDIINKDLKPMLIGCHENEHAIFRSAVKLLVGITTPIRCLTFVETSGQRIHASDIICELRQLLYRAKEAFLDPRSTRSIIAYVEILLEHQPLTSEGTQSVNLCLALLRNILHIPERPSIRHPQLLLSSSRSIVDQRMDNSQQNQIVCNLFAQGLSPLLLKLLDSPQKDEWVGTITQVISVLFKGRSAESIRNRMGCVNDTIAYNSSEEEDKSGCLSDNIDVFRKMTLSSPDSSSSSKRHKKENKFPKKKRRLEVQFVPMEEEVLKLLEIFVVDFMRKGYNTLVGNLHRQLLEHDLPMDEAQFFWLITYFLGFVPLFKLDIKHVKDVLDIEILSYLTWGVVRETEMMDKNFLCLVNMESNVRRLHRGVLAIREFLQVLKLYSHADRNESQGFQEWSRQLLSYLPAMRDLRQAFLLLLRQYNPNFQDRQYLRDVITTNHLLLITLKKAAEYPAFGGSCFDSKEHLKQFCTSAIVAKYGTALEDFKTNGTFVNKCIFTFLHHVNGDLGRTDLLLEPVILCPFGKIWEEKLNICEDWKGLIQCVLQTFRRSQQNCDDQKSGTMSKLSDQESPSLSETNLADQHFPVFRQLRTNIETLLHQLRNSGFQGQLDWIQSSLLKTCSAHLDTYGRNFYNPIASLSLKKKISCPIVPWTEQEAFALRSNRFFCLLQQLGLLPVSREAGFYPCIPHNWSPDILFRIALIFSPIDQTMVDFDLSLVTNITEQSHSCSLLKKSTNFLENSLQQTTQVNINNEEFLTRTPTPPHVSSRVLDWVVDQQTRIRGYRTKGEDTDETELSDSD